LGDFRIGLSGGVFQNKLLTEQVMTQLQNSGFEVYLPAKIPCNDGGLCAGQVMEYLQQQN
jgi:hydrogenase maturation protein HypF